MTTLSNSTKLTVQQLADLSDNRHRYELVNGVLHRMSPGGKRHGKVAMRVGTLLDTYIRQNDLGEVYAAETGFVLGRNPDTVRAPDVGFVAKARLAGLEDESGFLPMGPTWP